MRYELYKVHYAGDAVYVNFIGMFYGVTEAREAAKRRGPGNYRVCDTTGEVYRFKVVKGNGKNRDRVV